MYVGEGHTLATESSLLGTPSVIISSRASNNGKIIVPNLGNHVELQKYGLLEAFDNFPSSITTINKMLSNKRLKKIWQERRQNFLKDKIDVTAFLIDFVERYPQSFNEYKRGEYIWPKIEKAST